MCAITACSECACEIEHLLLVEICGTDYLCKYYLLLINTLNVCVWYTAVMQLISEVEPSAGYL